MDEKLFYIQKKGDDNVRGYSKGEFEEFFGIKYLPIPAFESHELVQELKAPWLLLHTIAGQEHRSLGSFLHKLLESGKVADVEIKWIDDQMGYGLFAKKFIAKEAFIGQYTGIVRKIARWKKAKLNEYCIHIPTTFWTLGYFFMDAEPAGNELRFANHADKPSMRPFCLVDRGRQHIGFFATQDIQPGMELTFDYGKDYWKHRSKK